MRKEHPFGFYSFLFVLSLSIFSIGNLIARDQSLLLLASFVSAFVAYLFLQKEKNAFQLLFGFGICVRLLLFFSLPSLSDDIYRFIWDGTLLLNGIHPFDNLPGFYLDQNIPGISKELFNKLNSPTYFTVYPPINQFIFWFSALIGGGNWLISTNVIRIILLAADIGSFWMIVQLLRKYNKSTHLAFWFFLNPLVILEFVGNAHFDGLVLFFLLAGINWFHDSKKLLSGSSFGLAIGTKLLPFIYTPFLLLKGFKTGKWGVAIIAGVVGILTILPMFSSSFIRGMQSSLNLYFQKFEFNASIYYIAREIGFWIYGYNKIAVIGPLLSILSFLSILGVTITAVVKKWSVPKTFLFVLFTYLLFATTVHPWYTLSLLAFGVLSGYYFPIVWSLVIFVTYLGYSSSGFHLPLGWIGIEYLIVLIAVILELKFKRLLIPRT